MTWEYLTLRNSESNDSGTRSYFAELSDSTLDSYGSDGWEMVIGRYNEDGYLVVATFKRPNPIHVDLQK